MMFNFYVSRHFYDRSLKKMWRDWSTTLRMGDLLKYVEGTWYHLSLSG